MGYNTTVMIRFPVLLNSLPNTSCTPGHQTSPIYFLPEEGTSVRNCVGALGTLEPIAILISTSYIESRGKVAMKLRLHWDNLPSTNEICT
jgi:hypothetical protein